MSQEQRSFIFESQPPLGNLGLHLSVIVPRQEGDKIVGKKFTAIFTGGIFVTRDPAVAKALLEDERCWKYRRYKVREVSKDSLEEQRRRAAEAEERAKKEAEARALAAAKVDSAEARAEEKARKEALKAIKEIEALEPLPDVEKKPGDSTSPNPGNPE